MIDNYVNNHDQQPDWRTTAAALGGALLTQLQGLQTRATDMHKYALSRIKHFFYKLQANYQTKKGVKPLILRPYFKYFEQGVSQPANYFETP